MQTPDLAGSALPNLGKLRSGPGYESDYLPSAINLRALRFAWLATLVAIALSTFFCNFQFWAGPVHTVLVLVNSCNPHKPNSRP